MKSGPLQHVLTVKKSVRPPRFVTTMHPLTGPLDGLFGTRKVRRLIPTPLSLSADGQSGEAVWWVTWAGSGSVWNPLNRSLPRPRCSQRPTLSWNAPVVARCLDQYCRGVDGHIGLRLSRSGCSAFSHRFDFFTRPSRPQRLAPFLPVSADPFPARWTRCSQPGVLRATPERSRPACGRQLASPSARSAAGPPGR